MGGQGDGAVPVSLCNVSASTANTKRDPRYQYGGKEHIGTEPISRVKEVMLVLFDDRTDGDVSGGIPAGFW